MKINKNSINKLFLGLIFVQLIIFGIIYLINNTTLNNLLPTFLIIASLCFAFYSIKITKQNQFIKKEDITKLVNFLENPMAVAYTDQITEEYLPILQAIKEFKFKHNRIITDFTETTSTLSENNNNIIELLNNITKFLIRFENNLNSLNDSLLLVSHIDMSYGEKEVASFLKVNVELEHFKEDLTEFTSILKQVYALYVNETGEILHKHDKVLKELLDIQTINEKQLSKNKEELIKFMKDFSNVNEEINNFTIKIGSISNSKNSIQNHSDLFFNVSQQISELETKVETNIKEVANAVNNLDDLSEKSRLLALNASIYAAEAGEHGKGFSIIATEMKKLADSSLVFHSKIRNKTTELNTGINKLKECNNTFLERKSEISESIETLSELSEFVVSFGQQISSKIFNTERDLKKIINSVENIQERVNLGVQKINPAMASNREKIYSLEHSNDLKHRIDKTLVAISEFNKKMNNEIPDVFKTLNTIFEKTSITYSNFVLIKENVEQFLKESTTKKAKQFRYELEGDNVRLFKDSVKILDKSHKVLKKTIE